MNRDAIAAIVTAQRAAQGLPPSITDTAALARIAALLKVQRAPGNGSAKRGKNGNAAEAVRS